ncbi:hypothetical protein BAE44_0018821, partial [Dichanthelium oligosanthes]
MFDVRSTARWWDDWELRILILGSLCLQWFLLLATPMRRYSIPHVFRALIGLSYISSNALAIYALGTLFNRHLKAIATGSSTGGGGGTAGSKQASILELLWAPILLIHLRGQEEMATNSVEDNKQWIGDTMTFVSKVAVAMYVFYKSWPSSSDWRLLAAAILLFVIGVISFSEKPWAHNKATIDRMAAISAVIQGSERRSTWRERLDQFFEEINCFTELPLSRSTRGEVGSQRKQVALSYRDKILMVFSDMSLLAAARDLIDRNKADKVEDVLPLLPIAEKALPRLLFIAFQLIYSRASAAASPLYLLYHLLVVPILHMHRRPHALRDKRQAPLQARRREDHIHRPVPHRRAGFLRRVHP